MGSSGAPAFGWARSWSPRDRVAPSAQSCPKPALGAEPFFVIVSFLVETGRARESGRGPLGVGPSKLKGGMRIS